MNDRFVVPALAGSIAVFRLKSGPAKAGTTNYEEAEA
jgi:hypothetical protein